MTFSRRALSLITVVFVFLLLGAGVVWRLGSVEGGEGEADAASEAVAQAEAAGITVPGSEEFSPGEPQPVAGGPVVRDTLWISVTASGEAEAARRTAVTNRVEGVVLSVEVEEGDVVEEGDLLVQLDTTEYALGVREAEADVLNAEAEFEVQMLLADEIADPEVRAERERMARAQSGLDQAQAALARARTDLERTRIRTPFSGQVANLDVVTGQFLPSGTEVLTVVQLDPIRVSAQVLEAEVPMLRRGRRAEVTFSAFPGETMDARIRTVNPLVDPDLRTARVTLELPNPDHAIKPGMYARVSLEALEFPDRVLVPRSAVLERDRRTMVFMASELNEQDVGVAEWRYVTTGLESDEMVEIVPNEETAMLEPGEVVLVDGHHYLAHDWPVRLVDDPEAVGGRPGR